MKMNKVLTRHYYEIKDANFGSKTELADGVLTINKEDLLKKVERLMKHVSAIDFELVKPGENTRIIHLLDTITPMVKRTGNGQAYPGHFSDPVMVGTGETNVIAGFTVMESCALPWDESSASSGLLYPRDAILEMTGPIAEVTPFYKTVNLVILYQLHEGKSSHEYDEEIRNIGLKIAMSLAELTLELEPDRSETYSIDEINPDLPNVVFVWQCQNQGVYANTLLYGVPIVEIVPTLLHPNEMLDGCIVSDNLAWPLHKVPTYTHVDHPIVRELYRRHGVDLNFRGVIFCRSHNPTNWHKTRCANMVIKIAQYLDADGLIMAWEGGGNAAIDGMLTIQCAEQHNIKSAAITFEFGGNDGTEGVLLVDDVPEANAIVSGGSIEKVIHLAEVERAVGGETLRLDKEKGGYFPPATAAISFDQSIHLYMAANQAGHSTQAGVDY